MSVNEGSQANGPPCGESGRLDEVPTGSGFVSKPSRAQNTQGRPHRTRGRPSGTRARTGDLCVDEKPQKWSTQRSRSRRPITIGVQVAIGGQKQMAASLQVPMAVDSRLIRPTVTNRKGAAVSRAASSSTVTWD